MPGVACISQLQRTGLRAVLRTRRVGRFLSIHLCNKNHTERGEQKGIRAKRREEEESDESVTEAIGSQHTMSAIGRKDLKALCGYTITKRRECLTIIIMEKMKRQPAKCQ